METKQRIRKVVTRQDPSGECGFFAALLEDPRVRKHLGMTHGDLEWEYISTRAKSLDEQEAAQNEPDTIYFNVGNAQGFDARLDQHGQPANQSLCSLCSLQLLEYEYDFMARSPWMREVYKRVCANDVDGRRLSHHQHNLRELMNGCTILGKSSREKLEFMKLSFLGIFELCKQGVPVDEVFDPERLKEGVKLYAPHLADEYENFVNLCIKKLKEEWRGAQQAVVRAEQHGKTAKIAHPDLPEGQFLSAILIRDHRVKTMAAARQRGYNVVMLVNPNGHVQIMSGTITIKEGGPSSTIKKRLRVNFSQVAHRLRILEANFRKKRLKGRPSEWSMPGNAYYEDGASSQWYLPEFLTAVFNGTRSSTDVEKTVINHNRIWQVLIGAGPEEGQGSWLVKCPLLPFANDE